MEQPALPAAAPAPSAPTVTYGSEVSPTTSTVDKELHGESFGSRVYHGVLGALGGTQDVALTGYDAQGKPVYSTTPMGPGQQWKKIISGALTGLAAGGGQTGPGSTMRKFGMGYQAGQAENERQQKNQQEQAQQTFENTQKAALNSAQTSMLTNQTADLAFRLGRSKVEAAEHDMDNMNKFHSMIDAGGDGTRDLGHFGSMQEVTQRFKDDPTLHDSHAQGQIVGIPHVGADGKIDGVDAAYVTKSWLDTKYDKDLEYTFQRMGKDGKMESFTQTIPKNSITNDAASKFLMAQGKDSMEEHWKKVQTEAEAALKAKQGTLATAEAGKAGAETKKTESETNMTDWELQFGKDHGYLPGKLNEGKVSKEEDEAEWGPGGYNKGFKPWEQKMVQPAQQVERGYELANQAYADYQAAKAAGKRLPTGAKSMLLLAQHIQNTFGMGKGARQTTHMIEQHLGARGVTDSMTVAFNKFLNGDELSEGQWNDFHELISQSRDAAWKEVIGSGDAIGRPLEKAYIPADMIKKYAKPKPPAAPAAAPGAAPAAAAPGGPALPKVAADLPPQAIAQVRQGAGKPVELFRNGVSQGKWQLDQAGGITKIP
jgi:hypothetical protein